MEINGTDKNILIVDDESVVRRMVEKILSKKNFTVIQARNGNEAIEQAMRYKLDLAILDVMMPIMDGFQTLQMLRKITRTKDVPIIILTAHANVRTFTKAVRLGADDFLAKPFSQHDILRKIQSVLTRAEERRAEEEAQKAILAAREGDPEWQRTRRVFIGNFEKLFPKMISLVLRNDLPELRNLVSDFLQKTQFYNLKEATRISSHLLQDLDQHNTEEMVGLLEELYEVFMTLMRESETEDASADQPPRADSEEASNSVENKMAQ